MKPRVAEAIGAVLALSFVLSAAASCVSFELRAVVSSEPPTAAPRAVTPGKGYGLISEYDGRTIEIEPDTDVIRLVLEDDVDWVITVDPSYLRLEQFGPFVARGFTAKYWMYRLLRSGETTVTAKGTSGCSSLPTCEVRMRAFSATLKIG